MRSLDAPRGIHDSAWITSARQTDTRSSNAAQRQRQGTPRQQRLLTAQGADESADLKRAAVAHPLHERDRDPRARDRDEQLLRRTEVRILAGAPAKWALCARSLRKTFIEHLLTSLQGTSSKIVLSLGIGGRTSLYMAWIDQVD